MEPFSDDILNRFSPMTYPIIHYTKLDISDLNLNLPNLLLLSRQALEEVAESTICLMYFFTMFKRELRLP